MTAAEATFLTAGQQQQPKKSPRPALRECPACGGRIRLANGRLEDHGIHRMTKTGIRESDKPCDGAGTAATRKEN